MAAAAALSGFKRNLRAEMKQRLRALSAEERLRQSRLLTEKVIAHSKYQESQRISIFLSMQDEIETEEIIKDIFKQGKTCFIPRYKFNSNYMDMVRLFSAEEIFSLPKTSWNIHQPGDDEVREEALSTELSIPSSFVLPVSEWIYETQGRDALYVNADNMSRGLDLIFMPGLGFDQQGNRLGRGKGYYDTYLKRCFQHQKRRPYTIALAFKEQICDAVPVGEDDMRIDEVLYEDK